MIRLQFWVLLITVAVVRKICCADLYSEQFASQLVSEWSGPKLPEMTLTTMVQEAYERNQDDPHPNYLMGIIGFLRDNYGDASSHFKRAAELSSFSVDLYLKNYVSVGSLHNYTAVAEYLTGLLVYQPMQSMVINMLIEMFEPNFAKWTMPTQLVLQAPTVVEMWTIYTMTRIPAYMNGDALITAAAEMDHSPAVDLENERNMTIYGLSLFPRSAELLLLRAFQSYNIRDTYCAQHYFRLASNIRHTAPASSASAYFERMQTLLNQLDAFPEATEAGTRDPIGCTCPPCFDKHTVEGYQSLYDIISTVAGDDWHVVGNATDSTRTVVNTIAPTSIHTIRSQLVAINNSAPILRRLPSLQVGCSTPNLCAMPGFLVADAVPAPSTHLLTQTYNLSMVADASVGLVYSSHTLEHLSHSLPPPSCRASGYGVLEGATPPVRAKEVTTWAQQRRRAGCESELGASLAEWRRVLITGGRLLVAVPDMELLMRYFHLPETTHFQKKVILKFLYGGQEGDYDFHKVGFYEESLTQWLERYGFCNVTRVSDFRIFKDSSSSNYMPGMPLSLNVVAEAC
jgi:predicted SAM-dependent methyltransferase